MSFQIAYGTELDQFTQIDTALYALFKMPFAEEWQNLDTPKPRWLTTIYWAFFLILSVLLLNLLIAIVTQVYPKKLAQSEDVWKATITDMMQLNLRNQKRNDNSAYTNKHFSKHLKSNRKGKKNRRSSATSPFRNKQRTMNNDENDDDDDESSHITLSECLNNKLILEGFDGYNFWRGTTGKQERELLLFFFLFYLSFFLLLLLLLCFSLFLFFLFPSSMYFQSTDMNRNNDASTDQEDHIFNDDENDDDNNIINLLGNETDTLYSSLTSGTNTQETLQQLMAAIRSGNGGPSGVGGEAWQKMENALKDQQEKFTMMQAKMKALDESLNGVVEMARETLMINKRLSATTDQVLSRRQGKR
jgi:hypothetical protein